MVRSSVSRPQTRALRNKVGEEGCCSLDPPAVLDNVSGNAELVDGQQSRGSTDNRQSLPEDKPPSLQHEPTFDHSGHRKDRSGASPSELQTMNQSEALHLDTFGLTELRDGFFDALFFKPEKADPRELLREAEATLPLAFKERHHPLSFRHFFPEQWRQAREVARRVATQRDGIKLLKTSVAFFLAYVLCLIPKVRSWLGRYSYILVVSAILNHPGRTLGAQLDGALLTIAGTATGLGWGSFGLWLSTSTLHARIGYGGVLALFLLIFMGTIAFMRSSWVRLYQLVLCAGIAVSYTCLSEVTGQDVAWSKLVDYSVPWALGQAISLLVCALIFPDAGAEPLAATLHNAFNVMLDGLVIPNPDGLKNRRRLAQTFVHLSQAYRDLAMDISVTRFRPGDIRDLRNHLQSIVRACLALDMDSGLFDKQHQDGTTADLSSAELSEKPVPEFGNADKSPEKERPKLTQAEVLSHIRQRLSGPTCQLLSSMRESLQWCDAVLMGMSTWSHRPRGADSGATCSRIVSLEKLRSGLTALETVELSLLQNDQLPASFANLLEVARIFAFSRPLRQGAAAVEAAICKVEEMNERQKRWPEFYLPSYPFCKSASQTNAQVRHDRGGVTAGSYYRSFSNIGGLIQKIQSSVHDPVSSDRPPTYSSQRGHTSLPTMTADIEGEDPAKQRTLRFRLWRVAKRFEGFNMKYAVKCAIVTSLLSIPAWLPQSNGWWNRYESWWAVVMVWVTMHPRVGGNIQDLLTRAAFAVLGAFWGGATNAAGDAAGSGKPYVIAVFAVVYMVPMLYRFTQSSHARSGLIGCLSFSVVSLGIITAEERESLVTMAVSRGLAFVVGVVAAVFINWLLWPFVARHELRTALSAMLFFLSVTYRSIIAKYVYYEEEEAPTKEVIQQSEILEGRIREGFVRVRQLTVLTRHELRLRAPFDPLPFSALTDSAERFFEDLVALRQSSLYFHPSFVRDGQDEATENLLGYRRDAVASIIGNLYILAGALRSRRKVPTYLPSAAAARKRLVDKTAEIETEIYGREGGASQSSRGQDHNDQDERRRQRATQILSYSYNESLTGCIRQLEQLEMYTKLIVGEQTFKAEDDDCCYSDEESAGEEEGAVGSEDGGVEPKDQTSRPA